MAGLGWGYRSPAPNGSPKQAPMGQPHMCCSCQIRGLTNTSGFCNRVFSHFHVKNHRNCILGTTSASNCVGVGCACSPRPALKDDKNSLDVRTVWEQTHSSCESAPRRALNSNNVSFQLFHALQCSVRYQKMQSWFSWPLGAALLFTGGFPFHVFIPFVIVQALCASVYTNTFQVTCKTFTNGSTVVKWLNSSIR